MAGEIEQQRFDFGGLQAVCLAQLGTQQHFAVLGQQRVGDNERKRRREHAIENTHHRGIGAAGEQPGDHDIGVDDRGADHRCRTACMLRCASARACASVSLLRLRARCTSSRAASCDLMP